MTAGEVFAELVHELLRVRWSFHALQLHVAHDSGPVQRLILPSVLIVCIEAFDDDSEGLDIDLAK